MEIQNKKSEGSWLGLARQCCPLMPLKTLFLTKMFVGNARTGDNEGVTHNYNLQTVYKVVAVTGRAWLAYHYISHLRQIVWISSIRLKQRNVPCI